MYDMYGDVARADAGDDAGYSETYSAREMERTITKLIVKPLSRLLIQYRQIDRLKIRVLAKERAMRFEISTLNMQAL